MVKSMYGTAVKIIKKMPVCVVALILNLFVAMIAIVPYIIIGKGNFALAYDFSAETIPFGIFINDAVKSGDILWNFNIDIGSNFFEAFSGFNGSPFFLITLLFPAQWYPKLIGWLIVLKFAIAGMTSCLYLERHVANKKILLIGTLLYSFSGFQCATIVFQFQDIIALFPLILYTLEILVQENKKAPFIFACAVNAMASLVNFVGIVIFLIIYYIFRYLIPFIQNKEKKQLFKNLKKIWTCLYCGFLGWAMSGVFSIPMIINLMGNTRAADKVQTRYFFDISTWQLLTDFKAFLLPAEPMSRPYSILESDWMTNDAYIPMFGIVLVLAYMWTKRDWLSNLIKTLFVFCIIPVLNNVFYLFSAAMYRRWYYMFILLLVLATIKVLEEPSKYKVKKGIIISCSIIALYVIMTAILKWEPSGSEVIFNKKCYIGSLGFAIVGIIVTVLLVYKKEKINYRITTVCVSLFCVAQLGGIIYQYQLCVDNTGKDFHTYEGTYSESVVTYLTEIPQQLERNIGPYRYYFDEGIGYTYYNVGMTNSLPTINSFISTVENSIFELYDNLNVGRTTMTRLGPDGTIELLGAKYIVSENVLDAYTLIDSISNANGQVIYIYENDDALPIGYAYDSYINESELKQIDGAYRAREMLKNLVIKDEDEQEVESVLKHDDNFESVYTDEKSIYISERQNKTCLDFEKGRNSFWTSYSCNNDSEFVLFSIPYSKYWSATVNGISTKIYDCSGLMAIPVEKGNSSIVFVYDYTPFKIGIVCSVIGILGGLVIAGMEMRKKKGVRHDRF